MAESKTTTEQQRAQGGQQMARSEPRGGGRGLQRRERYPFSFASPFAASPFGMMRRMSEEMDRMFDRFFEEGPIGRAFQAEPGAAVWAPRIEAFQKEDRFIVRAELPGVKKDDVQVELTDDRLIVQGQRREEQEEEREGFYRSELSYGSFYRAIPLPEGVIAESAEATFRDGVLEIRIQAPPSEVTKARRLEIKEGTEKEKKA